LRRECTKEESVRDNILHELLNSYILKLHSMNVINLEVECLRERKSSKKDFC